MESHTHVNLSGLSELARERRGGGRILIRHMRDIKESAVPDNLIGKDDILRLSGEWAFSTLEDSGISKIMYMVPNQ